SSPQGRGGVTLTNQAGDSLSFAFSLELPCTNNQAEYEALIAGLKVAKELGIRVLTIRGDSNLVVKQLKGEYGVKKASLALCRERAYDLIKDFQVEGVEHIPRADNRQADALATIGSKARVEGGENVVMIMAEDGEGKGDWRNVVQKQLRSRALVKAGKDFCLIGGKLYKKNGEELLLKCVSEEEGIDKMMKLHESVCGQTGPGLYRRLQRFGIFWPNMKTLCVTFMLEYQRFRFLNF
ncbi:MAG: ribonuclease HI family protein, partial [Sweet potato little leaf phytoplasma]|nr:ribonuclease HI family protein [Sweet potato little leaf phytoplasma]